nr:mat [Erythrotrichia carnea]
MFKNNISESELNLTSYIQSNGFSWTEIIHYVKSYQKEIYQYSSIGDSVKIRCLQDQLFCSEQAIFLAMRYIFNKKNKYQSKSKKCINSFLSNHANSLDRFFLQDRLLLIDLVTQELLLIILRPEWEARVESNSYGFSSGLAINQAVIKTYSILNENQMYDDSIVLVGKINNWITNLDSSLMLKKFNCSNNIKNHISSIFNESLFVSSSILINKKFQFVNIVCFPYNSIALLLADVIFYGLETAVFWKKTNIDQPYWGKITTVVYSEHFLVIFPYSNIQYTSSIIGCIRSFFKSVGLVLQNSSLTAQSIHKGFDFLGFNFRRYKTDHEGNHQQNKLIMKPTSNNIKKHLLSMRYCMYHKDRLNRWRANAQMTQYDVINKLNPLIKDFSHYYNDIVPYSILKLLDRTLNEIIYRYAIKKYKSDKSRKWDNNWTIVVNGKKTIGYIDEGGNGYRSLYLHNQ